MGGLWTCYVKSPNNQKYQLNFEKLWILSYEEHIFWLVYIYINVRQYTYKTWSVEDLVKMKCFHLALFTILLLSNLSFELSNNDQWNQWKLQHKKVYHTVEAARRYRIWKKELSEVMEHNRRYKMGLETYTKGMNEFSDLSWEDFRDIYLLESLEISPQFTQPEKFQKPLTNLPSSWDWRDLDAVTPVKRQVILY